jgi:hypothetical protein
MMASRSSQVTSSKGETPGREKWREKERPGARFKAGAEVFSEARAGVVFFEIVAMWSVLLLALNSMPGA